jgi:hypothetical protein
MHLRSLTLFLCVWIQALCVNILFAQDWSWQKDELVLNPSGLDLQDATSWAWGDLDGDGIPDVVVRKNGGKQNSRLEFWRGVESETPPYWVLDTEFSKNLNEEQFSKGISLADLDGNGKLNLITRGVIDSEWRLLYWYQDTLKNWQADTTIFAGLKAEFLVSDPFFEDIDRDGDFDMIEVEAGPEFDFLPGLRFFENVGSAVEPKWKEDSLRVKLVNSQLVGTLINFWSPILIDADDDGLLDLVLAYWLEFISSVVMFPGVQDSLGIHWSGEYQILKLVRHDRGLLKVWPFDINADGHKDLFQLELEGSGRIFLAENNAEVYFNSDYFRIGSIKFMASSSAIPFDYDNDANLDILTMGYFYVSDFNRLIHSYQKDLLNGRNLWRNTHWFTLNPFTIGKAQFTDLNLNGKVDFVISDQDLFKPSNTRLRAYENPQPDLQAEWVEQDELVARFLESRPDTVYFNASFSDLDSDGDQDLLITELILTGPDSGKSQLVFFENDLTADSVIWRKRSDWRAGLDQAVYEYSGFADLDRNGDNDLIFGAEDGGLKFYENVGGKMTPSWQFDANVFAGIDVGTFAAPAFADVDGDGRLDLFVGNREGELFFYRNESVVAVESKARRIPASVSLHQNYPNPFNPETTIEYELAEPGHVQLKIYNLRGQLVRTLVDSRQLGGRHQVAWDGSGERGESRVASGVYVYELKVGEKVYRKKMALLR